MKNILKLTTAADITDWANDFLVVTDIDPDPTFGADRVAIVRNLNINPEIRSVDINAVVYLLDEDGNPVNGYENEDQKNVVPKEVLIIGNNSSYVNLSTFEVITDLTGLTEGVDYLPEYEAYRLMAKSSPIDLFLLMSTAIQRSTKI